MELLVLVLVLVTIAVIHRRNTELERRIRVLEEALLRGVAPLAPGNAGSPGVTGLPVNTVPNRFASPPAEGPGETPVPLAPETPAGPPEPPAVPPPPLPPLPTPASPQGGGLEQALGTRWAVWVGGLALALGGIFLVRYSIEQDLIGPGLRVTMGLLFAFFLGGAGEWLRRRQDAEAAPVFARANVPAMLTAAGTSTAFAALFAAYALYGLIGPALAFAALGAVSLVTMAAAILHGPALAALGLVAALGSPLLVATEDPSPIGLTLYLAFATGSAYGVARIRLWCWLAAAAVTGALLWAAGLLVAGPGWLPGFIAHILAQLVLAILFLAIDPYRNVPPEEARIDRLATIPFFWFAVLAALGSGLFDASLARPLFVAAVAAAMTGAAMRVPAAAGMLPSAALAVVGALLIWPVLGQSAAEPERLVRDLAATPFPEAVQLFVASALVLMGAIFAAGIARLGYGARLRPGPAALYAAGATLGPLAAFVASYWRLLSFDHSIPFALVAGAIGLAFAGAAAWLRGRDPHLTSPALRLGVGATASAAVAALALGLTVALDRGHLTVALALSALGTALVARRLDIPALRWTVGALGIVVAGRLAWDPTVMRGSVGATPIVNWLLWGYGVPAASFLLAARVLTRAGGRDWVVRFVEALGFLFAALLVFLEIRHALHAGDPFTDRVDHLEAGLVVTEALGFTLLALRLDLRQADVLYRVGSFLFGLASLLGAAYALGFRYNPYLFGGPVIGGPILNSLAPAYLIPAALAALVARAAHGVRPRPFVLAAAGLALGLELAYAALEVRRMFHPDGRIDLFRDTSQAELWCYSLVLLTTAAALLAYGVVRHVRLARLAALACLVAAVLKVFLVDLSALEGLTQALSFVGLGLALVAVGLVYQRLVGVGAPPPSRPEAP